DEGAVLVHHAGALLVEVRAGRRLRAVEERFLFLRRRFAEIDGGELEGAADDLLPAHRMQLLEAFREDRNVARADLEKAVAAERASAPALQILRLRPHHRIEVLVGAREDGPVVSAGS